MTERPDAVENERIVLLFDPDTKTDPRGELPLRIVVASKLSDKGDSPDWKMQDIREKKDLEKIIATQRAVLRLDVPNLLKPGTPNIKVEIPITSLEDFHPDRIAMRVGEITEQMKIRQALVAMRSDMQDPEKREKLRESFKATE